MQPGFTFGWEIQSKITKNLREDYPEENETREILWQRLLWIVPWYSGCCTRSDQR